MRENRRAISLLGVLVTLTCVVVIAAVALVLLWHGRQGQARRAVDADRVREVHVAWLTLMKEFEIPAPAPGLLRRLAAPGIDRKVPGVGPEDVTQNTTANLYSATVMQNYLMPEQCVGPTEPSGRVIVHAGYDWSLYNPQADVYWDDAFKADLARLSNASYAHLPLSGVSRLLWTANPATNAPILGNRGPKDGVDDPASLTYATYPPPDAWAGHVVYGDNRVEFITTFTPRGADNIFAIDPGVTGDAVLAFTREMRRDGPLLQFD